MRRSRLTIAVVSLGVVCCVLAGGDARRKRGAQRPISKPVKITVAKETTWILGPVNPDGTVNYVAYLDAKFKAGITPENNAAIPLLRALGPRSLPPATKRRTLERLGIFPLPDKGNYFMSLSTYLWNRLAKSKDPAERAAFDATDARESKNLVAARTRPWSRQDYPILAKWLLANEKPLKLVRLATQRPRWYVPILSAAKSPDLIDFGSYAHTVPLSAGRALAARSMLEWNKGNFNKAKADWLTLHRLARLMSQGPTFIDRLRGMHLEMHAVAAWGGLVRENRLTKTRAKGLLADIRALPPLPSPVEALDEHGRFVLLDMVTIVSGQRTSNVRTAVEVLGFEIKDPPNITADLVDWDVVLRRHNSAHDRLVGAWRKRPFAEARKQFAGLSRDAKEMSEAVSSLNTPGAVAAFRARLASVSPAKARRMRSDLVAKSLLTMLFMSLDMPFHEKWLARTARPRLAVVSLALAVHKAEHGRWPARLAQLEPRLLKSIPDDPFTDKPLIYKRHGSGYVLYSVGPNVKDDGGAKDRKKKADDIAVHVK